MIKGQGYDYEPANIAQARRLVEECDLEPDRREYWTTRIDTLEYQSRGERTCYLVRRHLETLRELDDLRGKNVREQLVKNKQLKAARFLREAHEAFQLFLAFTEAHPELVNRGRDARYFRSPDELLASQQR